MIQCGICYGSVAMEGGGVRRLVNEVERVGEGGGYVDQFCRRIDQFFQIKCVYTPSCAH